MLFSQIPTQHFLGVPQQIPSLKASHQFQYSQDLLKWMIRKQVWTCCWPPESPPEVGGRSGARLSKFCQVKDRNALQINTWVCETMVHSAEVCCSWKNNHCAITPTPTALQQRQTSPSSQKTEDSHSKLHTDFERVTSLDEGLSLKRTCR